jgi:hypothetical protein
LFKAYEQKHTVKNKNSVSARDTIRDASLKLDASLNAIDFEGAGIVFVLGHPRSDIGKAELTARLALLASQPFSIIKVDGFLNTNKSGRHPSRVRNDFVVYRRFHEHIEFGGAHLILNAPLMESFFERFGESEEHLRFCPHLAKFFVRQVYENWCALKKPKTLFVEIGGSFSDEEVRAYIIPGLNILSASHAGIRRFLLAEAAYSGESIKLRPVIAGLSAAREMGLEFDVVFARLPSDFPEGYEWDDLNSYSELKIRDAMVCVSQTPKVICIPFFKGDTLTGYSEHLHAFRTVIFPTPLSSSKCS